jgi:hypothetical protein
MLIGYENLYWVMRWDRFRLGLYFRADDLQG